MTTLQKVKSILTICAIGLPAAVLFAGGPSWWSARGVIDITKPENNKGIANIGQLKWIATQAKAEMDAELIGGSGFSLPSFSTVDNFQPANLGQAKNLAKQFYDRMHAITPDFGKEQLVANGYSSNFWANEPTGSTPYPWTNSTSDDSNFSPLTVGQLKLMFSFDVAQDTDSDLINDLNEGILGTGFDPHDPDVDDDGILDGHEDFDGDGYHNALEIEKGSDAKSSGSTPDLTANAQFELYTPLSQQ